MPKLQDVLRANGVEIVARQKLGEHDWLLMIARRGSAVYPSPVFPSIFLYAEERDPPNISDEEAAMIARRFNPPLLPSAERKPPSHS